MKEVFLSLTVLLNLLQYSAIHVYMVYMYLLKECQSPPVCVATSIESLSIKINRQNLGDTYFTGVASVLFRTRCSLNNQTNSKGKSFRHDR